MGKVVVVVVVVAVVVVVVVAVVVVAVVVLSGGRAAFLAELRNGNDAIMDDYFWGSCVVLHALQGVLVQVEAFCSGCPCHGAALARTDEERRSRFRRVSLYQKAAGLDDTTACPLSGCRCPEVAAGVLEQTARQVADMQERSVFEDVMANESAGLRDAFTREWHLGIGLLLTGLVEKMSFWSQLPHFLCALASWDQGVVESCARKCLEMYSQLDESLHHPLSRLFLSPVDQSSFRSQIERLAAGARVADLPRAVRLFIVRMRFWSVLETPIEEKHARLTRTISRKTHWSGALVSLALRLPQFIRESELDPELYRLLVEAFQASLGHGDYFILEDLGLDRHPQVLDTLFERCMLATKRRAKVSSRLAKSIVYHADPESQFVPHADAAKFVKRNREKKDKLLRGAIRAGVEAGLQPLPIGSDKPKITASESAASVIDKFKNVLMVPHLQSLLQEGEVYSLPPLWSCVQNQEDLQFLARPLADYLDVRSTMRPSRPTLEVDFDIVADEGSHDVDANADADATGSLPRFFTVLQCAPSKAKLLRSTVAHGRFPAGCVAVMFHDAVVDRRRFETSREMVATHGTSTGPMALNLSLLKSSVMGKWIFKWAVTDRVEYTLTDFNIAGVATSVLHHLMAIGAVPGVMVVVVVVVAVMVACGGGGGGGP